MHDSPILSHIPRSSSVGSEPGHNPAPNVLMVPVAVTVAAAVVSPSGTNPVPSLVNRPAAAMPTAAPLPLASVPAAPSAHMFHQGVTAQQTSTMPEAFVKPSPSSFSPVLPSKSGI